MIRTLIKTAVSSAGSAKNGKETVKAKAGPLLEQTLAPRNPKMVNDFIRHVGGRPSWYKEVLPPGFFPQWGFPIMAKTLEGLPYNLKRILNGGCEIEVNSPIPMDGELLLKARLIDVDDNGYRVILKQKLITGTRENPEALISYVTAIVPLKPSGGPKKEKPKVPHSAREIDLWKLNKKTGIEFAYVTGDFNPVHWIRGYAKMAGFQNTIMHGFATMSRTIESLNKALWLGRPDRLLKFECRFVKPIVFPGQIKVFVDDDNNVSIGNAPGGPAFLTGKFTPYPEKKHE